MTQTTFADLEVDSTFEAPADAALAGLDDLRAYFVSQVRRVVPLALALADQLQQRWKVCVQAVVQGHTEKVLAQREKLTQSLKQRLRILREASRLADLIADLGEPLVPGSDQLAGAARELEKLEAKILSRWQDAESLEYLVAEEIAPSPGQFAAIAAKLGFPQAWYDEDSKPF